VTASVVDFTFPHRWNVEILAARPVILPPRHFVYPREVEEIERGALEVMVRPNQRGAPGLDFETWDPFLATCALGFRDPAAPTGLWSTPNPEEICAVSGGYAYLIDTTAPEHFTMIEHRPVLEVRPVADAGLLLFVGNRSIVAWGREGLAWHSAKLSDEGVTITRIEGSVLHGHGWEMILDTDVSFILDLQTGNYV
jgi:hypothetical protein